VKSNLLQAGVLVAAALALVHTATAQSWKPTRTIEMVVGAGSGGGNDRTARVIQKIMQETALLPTTMMVINRPGAGGAIAQEYLNTHAGDGHFLMVTNPALLTNQLTGVGTVKYTDMTPIAQLFTEYVTLFVKADSPLKTGKDVVERLRKDPGALSIAVSPGPDAGTHIATALALKSGGVDTRGLRAVSYKAAGEALAAVLGGHIDLMPTTPLNVLPQMLAGKVRVLAISAPRRLGGNMASVPTWREQGFDVVFGNWRGVIGPRGLSKEQIEYWDQVFSRLNATEEWNAEIKSGLWEETYMNSRDARAFLDKDFEQLRRILTDLGLATN
jgi:putative tricarboxylic transport membrane protein